MEFKDRVANKPNRVKLTYDEGGSSVYATVELADEPIEEGTPLNALNMNKLLNKEDNDYIVEQGTAEVKVNEGTDDEYTATWTYRKWNSGIAECWTSSCSITSPIATAWGSLFVSNEAFPSIPYPFNMAATNKAPITNVDLAYNGSNTMVGYCFDPTTNTEVFYDKVPTFRVWSAVKQDWKTVNVTARISVIGRWK